MPRKILHYRISQNSVQYGSHPSRGAYDGTKHFISRQFDFTDENHDEIQKIQHIDFPGLVKQHNYEIIENKIYQILEFVRGQRINENTHLKTLFEFLLKITKFLTEKNISIGNLTEKSLIQITSQQFYLIDYGSHLGSKEDSLNYQIGKILLFCKPTIINFPVQNNHKNMILKRKLKQLQEENVESFILREVISKE